MLLYVTPAPSAAAGGSALTVAAPLLCAADAAGPVNARTGCCGAASGERSEGLHGRVCVTRWHIVRT